MIRTGRRCSNHALMEYYKIDNQIQITYTCGLRWIHFLLVFTVSKLRRRREKEDNNTRGKYVTPSHPTPPPSTLPLSLPLFHLPSLPPSSLPPFVCPSTVPLPTPRTWCNGGGLARVPQRSFAADTALCIAWVAGATRLPAGGVTDPPGLPSPPFAGCPSHGGGRSVVVSRPRRAACTPRRDTPARGSSPQTPCELLRDSPGSRRGTWSPTEHRGEEHAPRRPPPG